MASLDEIFQRTFGLTDAEMAESAERGRVRAAERAEDRSAVTIGRRPRATLTGDSWSRQLRSTLPSKQTHL